MVRFVASVSAKKESSPEGFGFRDEVLVDVQLGSLIKAAAQGVADRRDLMASPMMYERSK